MTATDPDRRLSADYDHRDPAFAPYPYDRWQRLRDKDPIGFSDHHGGFHVISRYAEVCEVTRSPEYFSNAQNAIPALPVTFPPISYDPPDNRKYRILVNPYFSPAALAEHVEWIEKLADQIMTPLLESPRFDFSSDLGVPLTRDVILRLMGITDPPAQMNEWSDRFVQQDGDVAGAAASLMAFLGAEITARRENPGTDMLSGLVQGTFDDRYLDDDELVRMALLLLTAGLETTNSAMTATTMYLVDHPETCAEFVARPEIWDLAMDEFVRWSSPASTQGRKVIADTEFHGCPMHAGEQLQVIYGSANRDEREFSDPDKIVLDRFPNRHVGFGMGPHRCLGSHLAKMEMKIVFSRLVPVLSDWEIESRDKLEWHAGEVRSLRTLPLVRKARV